MRSFVIMVGAVVVAGSLFYTIKRGHDDNGLTVGQAAPDFTATTLDRQTVRLSELRGKVVVLDFWATWCPPCRQMIPHEREMVQKLAGKPFVFLSISADNDQQELRKFVQENSMAWPHIGDGPAGPLQQLYHISYYPTVFVLDAQGIIRSKDVRNHDLEQAVEKLLAGTQP